MAVGASFVLILVLTGVAVVLSQLTPADQGPRPLPARVDPLLPDLTIAPYSEFTGSRVLDTRKELLRFGVMIVNVGDGDFMLSARRPHLLSDAWEVVQRIPERAGGFTERATPASLVFGGDGHDHWHIREVESHRLETLDGVVLGEVIKQGYCFFDTDLVRPGLPGAAAERVYRSTYCGDRIASGVSMGLSVGWGDEYPWHMLEQQIEITGLPDGTYRLVAVADPFGWFEELNEENNTYWEEFELGRDAYGLPEVKVLSTSTGETPRDA
jgi:hypothetical protein